MRPLVTIGCIAALSAFALAAPSTANDVADFTVQDVFEEEPFTLSDARGSYVAIHFLLDTKCPICARHVEEYIRNGPSFPKTKQIFLKGGEPWDIVEWTDDLNVIIPPNSKLLVYHDLDAKVARSMDLPLEDDHVQYPAFILIGPDGREIMRYVGISKWDHYPLESFRDRMNELDYDPVIRRYNIQRDRLALQGYDAVDYVERDTAREGTSYFTARYQGAIYYFASDTNRVRFSRNPDKYLPAYGGWCAKAMAEGKRLDVDPTVFKVTNGRLFLFHSDSGREHRDAWRAHRDAWVADETALTKQADRHWKAAPSE